MPAPGQVLEVQPDMMTCAITEGLTEDAVSARLHQGESHLVRLTEL